MSRTFTEAAPAAEAPGIVLRGLFAPVDIASLVFFRAWFGAMMLWALWDLHHKGLIASAFIDPPFHFTYHGFSWVRPWPGAGMYIHFAALAILAAGLLVGFLYRISALLLWLGFTYVFLLEKALYLNHDYLICLLCFLFVFLPAQRACSIDALLRPGLRADLVPAWTLWLLRFQVGLPYVYGGLAKLGGDWLQGQPMQLWLSIGPLRYLFGPVMEERWMALLFSWGGLIFDLAIVPLLLWRRTRAIAFAAAVAFHLLNAFMFDIGVFPWLMIGATTVFFDPDWPRRLVSSPYMQMPAHPRAMPAPRLPRLVVVALCTYVIVQLIVPMRQWLYPGNVLWTEEGHYFAWHMMLRAKVNALRFVTIDRASGAARPVDPARWLSAQQIESMGYDPEMMREFAEFVRHEESRQGRDVEVRVLALCSLNGRKPQPLIDPRVDLSRRPRRWGHADFIVPLREPLRRPAWDVPVEQWEKHLSEP